MKRLNTTIYILVTLVFLSKALYSQSLIDGAESVAFDSLNNRYLVTSLNSSKIISIDKSNNQTLFKENIVAFGNCIKDSIIYVTGNATIKGLNVNTALEVFSVTIGGARQLDGITIDNNGNLYTMETLNGIVYKVNITTKRVTRFVDGGFGRAPQDLIYDKFKNRLLVCQWHENSSIKAINLEDSSLTTVVEESAGFADGITIDQRGDVYVTSYTDGGQVFRYDNDFSEPGELIYKGIPEPAGLDYNIIDDVLAVPSFAGDSVLFIKNPRFYILPTISVDNFTGHAPLTLNFLEESLSNPIITKWEWDFNSDGIIDSHDKNPEWTFNDPGIYNVTVSLSNDSTSTTTSLEDSIRVFSGESSINFENSNSHVKIPPSPEFNLSDKWTIEAWIFPTNLFGKYIFHKGSIGIYTNKSSGSLGKNNLVVKLLRENNPFITFASEDSSLVLNKWQHIAVTYDQSEGIVGIIINGKQQELSKSNEEILTGSISDNSMDTLYLGNNNTNLRSLKGKMDEIRIWNKALSETEIKNNIFEYLVGSEQNLISYWNFNEGNGSDIIDISENGNNGKLFDGAYDFGIDYSTVVGVDSEKNNSVIENNFELKQNYPNPFNPSTIISFTIPESSELNNLSQIEIQTRLTIYNLLGQEIKTLMNKNIAPGKYSINFDADNVLSSGVYIYKLETGNYSQSKKMILMR